MSDNHKYTIECFNLIKDFFSGDLEKTLVWLGLENPLLGEISACDMIAAGRSGKLLKIIKDQMEGNVA